MLATEYIYGNIYLSRGAGAKRRLALLAGGGTDHVSHGQRQAVEEGTARKWPREARSEPSERGPQLDRGSGLAYPERTLNGCEGHDGTHRL